MDNPETPEDAMGHTDAYDAELGIQGTETLLAVVDDAFKLVKFSKGNEYPPLHSPKFFEFTELCHNLECSLREAGWETASRPKDA